MHALGHNVLLFGDEIRSEDEEKREKGELGRGFNRKGETATGERGGIKEKTLLYKEISATRGAIVLAHLCDFAPALIIND